MKNLFFIIFAAGLSLVSGCCCKADKNASGDNQIVAMINGYELTAGDFRDESPMAALNMKLSANPEKAKEDSLNELVTRKILLQEAQRENFDKDRKFMKEIERYWEQALLKLLMKKKIDEFSKSISPDIPSDTRRKILQAELDRWITGLRNAAKVKIYKENLKKIEMR